jgi:hypothetical protein
MHLFHGGHGHGHGHNSGGASTGPDRDEQLPREKEER